MSVEFLLVLALATPGSLVGAFSARRSSTPRIGLQMRPSDKGGREALLEPAPIVAVPSKNGAGLPGATESLELGGTDGDMSIPSDPTFWKATTVVLCVLWASNFPVIKVVYDNVPSLDPSLFSAVRFGVATAFYTPALFRMVKESEWGFLLAGFFAGLSIFPGHFGQAMGLLHSSSDKGAFICSLSVVWVALLDSVLTGKFTTQTWVSSLLAVVGTAFLELQGSSPPTVADAWFLLQPIGFGTGYVLLERLLKKFSDDKYVDAVTGLKMGSMFVAASLWAAYSGHSIEDIKPLVDSPVGMAGTAYVSLITTAAAIGVQSYAFRSVSAADSAVILACEPIFAAAIAVALLGETLGISEFFGGSLIILACLVNELNLVNRFLPATLAVDDEEKEKVN